MKNRPLALLCAAVVLFALAAPAQFTVNFQFNNGAGGAVPLYSGLGVPGLGSGTSWNTIYGPASGSTSTTYASTNGLADNGVNETGIRWVLTTKGNWSYPQSGTINLLNSYALVKTAHGAVPFSLTNVPSGTYNLVVFGLAGNRSGQGTAWTVNGVSQSVKEPANANTSFVLSNNYVVFSNLVVSSGTLSGTYQTSASTNTGDAHFNGLQLQRVSSITAFAFAPKLSPTNYVNGGSPVTLTANALGVGTLSYQWQTDGGGATLTNIPGATANPFQFTASTPGTIHYAVVVTDASGSFTSPAVTLTVSSMALPTFFPDPPAATPASTTFVGNPVTFSTEVKGTMPIALQWQVNKGSGYANILNATNSSLTLSNVQFSDAGTYRLHATNSVGTSDSLSVSLSVLAAPSLSAADSFAQAVLTQGPIGYWRLNDPAGSPVVYDWAGNHVGLNNNVLLGAPGLQGPAYPGFSTTNTAGAFDGSTSAITTGASLMNGMTKFTLVGWFSPSGVNPVNTSGLFGQYGVVEFGYFDSSGVNVWMPTTGSNSWTVLRSGPSGFTSGQWYCTALVADGTNVTIYVNGQPRAQALSAGAPKGSSSSGFNIGGGAIFDANNDPFNGTIGDVALFNVALSLDQLQSLYVAGVGERAPAIATQPASQELIEGHTASFTVGASGFPLAFQWQAGPGDGSFTNLSNGGNISGVTNATLTLANVSLNQAGLYRVVVSNAAGVVTSDPATLTVDPKPAGQWVVNFAFSTTAGGIVPPYSGPGVLGTGTYWNSIPGPNAWAPGTFNSSSAWTDDGWNDTQIVLSLTTSGNWSSPAHNNLLDSYAEALNGAKPFTFNQVFNGVYNLVLFGINGGYADRGTTFTVNGVSQSTTNTTDASFVEGDNYVIFRNVVVNNGVISGTWAPNPIPLGGTNNTEGDFCGAQLQYVADALAPTIVTQPVARMGLEGRAVPFTVVADGTPLNYQWQSGPVGGPYVNVSDGGNLSGANAATLTVANITAGPVRQYRVVVSNSAGSVTSTPATLTVIPQTQTWVVNFDFDTTEGGSAGTYAGPGVVGSGTYWNSIPGPKTWTQGTYTGTVGLSDDGAIDTGISCAVTIDGSWCYPATGAPNPLLDDYAEALSGVAKPFTFGNVYNGVYNLVLFGVNGGYHSYGTTFTVNGVSKSTVNATDATFVEGDNYVIYRNLVVTNGTLSGTYGANTAVAGNVQGDFCGAQLQYVGQSIVPLEPPTLALQPAANGQLRVQWSQGTLLEATNLAGPWTTNTATSPYLVTPPQGPGQKFFRVRVMP